MSQNWRATVIGAVVTVAFTIFLFLLPAIVPFHDFQLFVYHLTGDWMFDNPLVQLRLLGGIPGAIISGYLARDDFGNPERGTSMTVGIYATFLGLLVFLLVIIAFNIYGAVVRGVSPPPIYSIVLMSTIITVPMLVLYPIEGIVCGVIGATIRKTLMDER